MHVTCVAAQRLQALQAFGSFRAHFEHVGRQQTATDVYQAYLSLGFLHCCLLRQLPCC
jgi:hypothetical protein